MMPVCGLYGHSRRNAFLSLALFSGFAALLMAAIALFGLAHAAAFVGHCPPDATPGSCLTGLGYLTATWSHFVAHSQLLDSGWILALAVALTFIAVNVWWCSIAVRLETGARIIERRDAPQLHAMVEALAITAGLPCPRIEIIEIDKLNAYATGYCPSRSTIGLTSGLLAALPRRELEAVIAHELAHIKLRDNRLMAIAKASSDVSFLFAKLIGELSRQPLRAFIAGGLAMIVVGPVATTLLIAGLLVTGGWSLIFKSMISQTRELVADAAAIDLTRDAVALVSALRRMRGNDGLPGLSPATRAMMFSDSGEGTWGATHPGLEHRIAAIMRYALVTEADLAHFNHSVADARYIPPIPEPRRHRPGAGPALPSWIEKWIVSGRADRSGKLVLGVTLTALLALPVLLLLPGRVMFLLMPF